MLASNFEETSETYEFLHPPQHLAACVCCLQDPAYQTAQESTNVKETWQEDGTLTNPSKRKSYGEPEL